MGKSMSHPHPDDCPECKGRGYFLSDNGPAPQEYDCPECDGTGEYVWAGLVPANPMLPVGMGGLVA